MWFEKLELYNPDTDKTFILAPRPRYSIEKIRYTPNVARSSCANCGDSPIEDWEIVYTIHCLGNGDLAAARIAYNKLVAAAKEACSSNKLHLVLQYCNEEPLEHDISSAYVQPVDTQWNPDCCDSSTFTAELHMTGLEPIENVPEIIISNYLVYTP